MCCLPCVRPDHKIYNKIHFKSFINKGKVGKRRVCAALSGRNMGERGNGAGVFTLKGSSGHVYRTYNATPQPYRLHGHPGHVHRLLRVWGPGVTRHFTWMLMAHVWSWDPRNVNTWGKLSILPECWWTCMQLGNPGHAGNVNTMSLFFSTTLCFFFQEIRSYNTYVYLVLCVLWIFNFTVHSQANLHSEISMAHLIALVSTALQGRFLPLHQSRAFGEIHWRHCVPMGRE